MFRNILCNNIFRHIEIFKKDTELNIYAMLACIFPLRNRTLPIFSYQDLIFL